MNRFHPDIRKACRHSDFGLWEAFSRSRRDEPHPSGHGRLLFPEYRNGSLRVSEQEARFAFVESLSDGKLLYSVEAPTSKRYQFTGKTPLSAQTDLAIYDETGVRICNVEFKAKGVRGSGGEHFPIYKDLQKLLREPVWGLWFHLLESVDNSTINGFLRVMAEQIARVQRDFPDDIESPGLTIHICVLQHGFAVQRDLGFAVGSGPTKQELETQLRLDHSVSRNELLAVSDANGWDIFKVGDQQTE